MSLFIWNNFFPSHLLQLLVYNFYHIRGGGGGGGGGGTITFSVDPSGYGAGDRPESDTTLP